MRSIAIGNYSVRILSLLLLLAGAYSAAAKQEQVMTRGFNSERAYAMGEVDAVDVMSGNLTVQVPLGQQYTTNGSLSYSFGLTYNSNIWDYQDVGAGKFIRQFILEYVEVGMRVDELNDGDLPANEAGMESYPSPNFNAGLGWNLSLGQLRSGYIYVDPSGATHPFYSTLTGDMNGDNPHTAPGPLYTRDGTYLRMTKVTARERLIEFPDGIRQRFVCNAVNASDCSVNDPEWLLDEMSDPFGNLLYIERSASRRPASGTWTWTFREVTSTPASGKGATAKYLRRTDPATAVRSHTLVFEIPAASPYELRLKTATLAASGGTAQYTFNYTPRSIYRDHGHTWGGTGLKVPFNNANKVSVSVLSGITLPQAAGSWSFDYVEMAPNAPDADLLQIQWGEGVTARVFHTSKKDGRLRQLTLPTGGRIEYEYAGRTMPTRRCFAKRGESGQFAMLGVTKRRVYDVGATTPSGEWLYYAQRYRSQEPPTGGQCDLPKEYVVTTVGPVMPSGPEASALPHRPVTVSYFSAYRDENTYTEGKPWSKDEYGLPFTKAVTDGGSLYLSSEVYSCAQNAFDADLFGALRRLLPHRRGGDPATCGEPLRSTFVRYEHSGRDCSGDGSYCPFTQRREAQRRIVHHARNEGDVETYEDTIRSEFDGLGHYRVTTTGGNIFQTIFPSLGGSDERISRTNYNPGTAYSTSTHQITPGPPQRWLLGLYDYSLVKERRNGKASNAYDVVKSEADFAPDTGFLRRSRQLSSSNETRSGNDLLQVFERTCSDDPGCSDPTRVRVRALYYGGDATAQKTLTDEPLPDVDLPSKPEYAIDRIAQYGGTALVQYMNCDLAAPFFTVESNVVDAATGLVTSSSDHSGATSTLGYDRLGRLTSFTPHNETATSYAYTVPAGSTGPKVTSTRGPAGATQLSEIVTYDGFGRVAERRSRVPDNASGNACGASGGCWSKRQTTYRADGLVETESVTVDSTAAPGWRLTRYWYDALNRKVVAQTPDNAKATYDHYGAWHLRENLPSVAARDLYYDRHGRLVKVTQGIGAPFRYEYDAGGRLAKTVAIQGAADSVRSTFYYDNRGYLSQELHPEIGANGVRYEADSRGNRIALWYPGEGSKYDLTMRYDAAERLTDVYRSDKALKTFTYHPSSVPLAGGKLATAERINVVPTPGATRVETEYKVRTSYEYDPSTGRLAAETLSSPSTGFQARTAYTYNSLGQPTQLRYPDMCAAATPCSRLLTYTYGHGLLQTVSDFVTATRYHPNGMVRKLVRSNGTEDEIGLADHGMARPSYIVSKRTGTQQEFARFGHAGAAITYDTAGNITRVPRMDLNHDTFAYDDLGRLRQATVGGVTQSYGYDLYGNMTSDGSSRNLATNPATNQLSAAKYDHAGNLEHMPDPRPSAATGDKYRFEWDSHGMVTHHTGPAIGKVFLYDAFDERAATLEYASGPLVRELWTVRDASKRVLSDFQRSGTGTYARARDYIHAGSSLVAAVEVTPATQTVRHHHVDFLGTPRTVTNSAGALVMRRDYLPFGEEVLERNPSASSRLELTGHERDDDGTDLPGGDLDYMHARYYSPGVARFLSVDPVAGRPEWPQSWNRYGYVYNNAVNFHDPEGAVPARLFGADVDVNPGDVAVLAFSEDPRRTGAHVATVFKVDADKNAWVVDLQPVDAQLKGGTDTLVDSRSQQLSPWNSNDYAVGRRGEKTWSAANMTLVGIVRHDAAGGKDFTTAQLEAILSSINQRGMIYSSPQNGQITVPTDGRSPLVGDCAATANLIAILLGAGQNGQSSLSPAAWPVSAWQSKADAVGKKKRSKRE